jgi:hypothetical protein
MDSGFLFRLASAVCSAVSLEFMLIFDRVMLSDCNRGRPRQAWLVSSILGSLFGLVATAFVWIASSTNPDNSLSLLSRTFFDQFWPNGFLMLIAGAITVQSLTHYFNLFSSAGHDSDYGRNSKKYTRNDPITDMLTLGQTVWRSEPGDQYQPDKVADSKTERTAWLGR